ncbi:ComEC/Rec2 family competence protein [Ktedonospora formicarum]|uniref:Metallo-beta-lactamase domain-containing protein n=1 Tax=Ktedonospora formicarum TaxID=2778364 RepID=A0A8J3MVW6_9CHLR|nr:hypothetical protein [Ktedonospora formicarum]GHO50787.1 hypothetical protein KSX_89500 [Ktedonospora formicarum]
MVAVTHYDKDHVGGLCHILLQPQRDSVRCYDQGWPEAGDAMNDWYTRYVRAVSGYQRDGARRAPALKNVDLSQRRRPTNRVRAGNLAPTMPAAAYHAPAIDGNPINQAARWLVLQEILWNPNPVPAGAPSIICIAANTHVAEHGGTVSAGIGGNGADPRNEKSLAFLVTFNNFRYYVGGDLETQQEDELCDYLNHADNANGRVQAMKASHHGAHTSSSQDFIDCLRPEAVFISCGTDNQYDHPHQAVTDRLDAGNISHYLTGESEEVDYLGNNSYIAGGDDDNDGHIVLKVSAAQSNRPPTSANPAGIFSVSYYDGNTDAMENITHTGV